jgi:hypothetical protein
MPHRLSRAALVAGLVIAAPAVVAVAASSSSGGQVTRAAAAGDGEPLISVPAAPVRTPARSRDDDLRADDALGPVPGIAAGGQDFANRLVGPLLENRAA